MGDKEAHWEKLEGKPSLKKMALVMRELELKGSQASSKNYVPILPSCRGVKEIVQLTRETTKNM